jgi:hypothetical protein
LAIAKVIEEFAGAVEITADDYRLDPIGDLASIPPEAPKIAVFTLSATLGGDGFVHLVLSEDEAVLEIHGRPGGTVGGLGDRADPGTTTTTRDSAVPLAENRGGRAGAPP